MEKTLTVMLTIAIILMPYLILIASYQPNRGSDLKIDLGDKSIFVVGRTSSEIHSKLSDYFGKEKVRFTDRFEDLYGKRVNIVISHTSDLYKSKPIQILQILEENKDNGVIFITISNRGVGKEFSDVLGAFLKALKGELPIEIVDITTYGKRRGEALLWDQRIYEAQIVAFSINPFGWFIAEEAGEMMETLLIIIKEFLVSPQPIPIVGATRDAPEDFINSITQNGFNWIGYVGWKTKDIKGYLGDTVGRMYVRVDYYYNSQTVGSTTYKFFLAHVKHSMIGYFSGILNHIPKVFITETDWRTSTYPGQVLFDWGPKNQGGPQSSISFTLTVGLSGASASVTYTASPPASFYWKDQTNPAAGDVKTEHTLASATINVMYTVEPSSIGHLDPNKPGGTEPMLVRHYTKSMLAAGLVYEWADLSFSVSLRSSGVSEY